MGHSVRFLGRIFLCFFSEQNVSDTLGSLGLDLLDDVGVKAFCGVYVGVAQLLGDRDNICAICQQDRGYRVAESVGVDMGQAVAVREVIEPVGDTVRVHVVAVVLGKDIAGMNPAVTIGKLQPELFPLVLPEQLHGFAGSGSKRQSPVLVLPS